jgi:hypothetical protein
MQNLIEDAALREKLGAAARTRARRFTAEVSWPRLERLYALVSRKPLPHAD